MFTVKVKVDTDKIKKAIGQKVAQMDVDVSCPECGKKSRVKAADFAAKRTITCLGCRKSIKLKVKDDGLSRVIRGK